MKSSSHRCAWGRIPAVALTAVVVFALATASKADARSAYVANAGNGTVSVFDTGTGAAVATIATGGKPVDLAISPDGSRAYVVDEQRDVVLGIDTATGGVFAAIPVGKEPRGIAITPDGGHALVTDFGDASLSVVDLAANTALKAAIPVSAEPEGIAVSGDGLHAYVAHRSGGIAVVDLPSSRVISVIADALAPARLALTPNGGRLVVTNSGASSVSVFNTENGRAVGGPIGVPATPAGVAVSPKGRFAYAASPNSSSVSVIDITRAVAVGAISGLPGANGVAIEPSGARGVATAAGGAGASIFATTSSQVVGMSPTGPDPRGVAVVPNQGPSAQVWVSPVWRFAKRKLTFHAGASSDPDGSIASYAWEWGDGHHVKSTSGFKKHRYARPGLYQATLTVTDNDGCSTKAVFTGQTVSCNGSSQASTVLPIEVLNRRVPGLRLNAGRRQRVRGIVSLFAKCPLADCGLRARGTIFASFRRCSARRNGKRRCIKIKHHYKMHLGPVIRSATARTWTWLPLELPRGRRRAVARALRNAGRVEVKLTVIARDVHGISQLRHREIRLVLGHRARPKTR